jgi:hypothetical protein
VFVLVIPQFSARITKISMMEADLSRLDALRLDALD